MTSVLTVDFYSDTLSEYMDVRVIMPTLENGKNVLAGIYKIKEILDVHRVIIAIEDNKPDAIEALTRIADDPKNDPND